MTMIAVATKARDGDSSIRESLARDVLALAKLDLDGDDDDLEAFARALKGESDAFFALIRDDVPAVRAAAIEAVAALVRHAAMYRHDDDASDLSLLIGEVGERARSQVPTLIAMLDEDHEPLVGSALAHVLTVTDHPRAPEMLLRRLREDGPNVDPEHVRALRHFAFPSEDARAVLLPLLAPTIDVDTRRHALYAMIEHADLECREALLGAVDVDVAAAMMALARIGPRALIPDLRDRLAAAITKHDFEVLGWTAACGERHDAIPILLEALRQTMARERDDLTLPTAATLVGIASVFPDRRLFVDVAPLLSAPADHASGLGPTFLALGMSGITGAVALVSLAANKLEPAPQTARLRLQAALGIALLDVDALDTHGAAFVPQLGEPIAPRVDTFEMHLLPIAFACRALARRLAEEPAPLSATMRQLIAVIVSFVDNADFDGAIATYRERSTMRSLASGWSFVLRDLFFEARDRFAARLQQDARRI